MKDIDFDELDRAVGSVLGSNTAAQTDEPATVPVATAGPVPTSIANSTAPLSSDTSTKVLSSDVTSTPVATVSPVVSPARKRGQFLDMVHPSADMTKTPKMPTTARKTVVPLNPTVIADVPASRSSDETAATPPVEAPAQPIVPPAQPTADRTPVVAENTTDEDSTQSWPDPLDFAKESAEAAVISDEPQPSASPTVEATDESGASESAQTPFVADAKVDKRPLGAFAAQEDEAPGQAPTEDSALEEAPEFNPEVNSVEATGVPQAEDEATGLTGETPKDEPLEEHSTIPIATSAPEVKPVSQETVPEVLETPEEPKEPAAPVAVAAPVAGAASIPQQYKAADPHKKEDTEPHPLFDTDEYHQPLLPDGKKKSKKIVLIIVLLVLLLIIGGALGYVAYTIGI